MSAERLQSHLGSLRALLVTAMQRLGDPADTESLHEMRVVLRRLRMLLRPLTRSGQAGLLRDVAAGVFRQTNSLRDNEVLLEELVRSGMHVAVVARQAQQMRDRQALMDSPGLDGLIAVWPADGVACLSVPSRRRRRDLKQKMRRESVKARRKLRRQLRQPAPDLHEVRLAIKRLRYRLLAQGHASPSLLVLLELGQEVLGQWHDHDAWLLRAVTEPDLQGCIGRWQHEKAVLQARWLPLRDGLLLVL